MLLSIIYIITTQLPSSLAVKYCLIADIVAEVVLEEGVKGDLLVAFEISTAMRPAIMGHRENF